MRKLKLIKHLKKEINKNKIEKEYEKQLIGSCTLPLTRSLYFIPDSGKFIWL